LRNIEALSFYPPVSHQGCDGCATGGNSSIGTTLFGSMVCGRIPFQRSICIRRMISGFRGVACRFPRILAKGVITLVGHFFPGTTKLCDRRGRGERDNHNDVASRAGRRGAS